VTPEIVFATASDSLYVLEPDGKRRAGWPKFIRAGGNSKSPSPALADMTTTASSTSSTEHQTVAVSRSTQRTALAHVTNVRYSSPRSAPRSRGPVWRHHVTASTTS